MRRWCGAFFEPIHRQHSIYVILYIRSPRRQVLLIVPAHGAQRPEGPQRMTPHSPTDAPEALPVLIILHLYRPAPVVRSSPSRLLWSYCIHRHVYAVPPHLLRLHHAQISSSIQLGRTASAHSSAGARIRQTSSAHARRLYSVAYARLTHGQLCISARS